jgi:hypothetical protein
MKPCPVAWTGDGVPSGRTNTPYCTVGPMGLGSHFKVHAKLYGQMHDLEYATYADVLGSLSCGGVTIDDPEDVTGLYLLYNQQPGVSATKFCGNCPWSGGFSGPVSSPHASGNTKTGTLSLSSPGSYQVGISQGGRSLSLNVEGLNIKFQSSEAINLAWEEGSDYS